MNHNFSYLKLCLYCTLYSLVYTFCLYKNYSGITFPFFAAGTLCFFLFFMKKQGLTMNRYSGFLITAIMIFAINICMTDSDYLALMDRGFIFVLFFTLFLTNIYDDTTWDVSRYAGAISLTVLSSIKYLGCPIADGIRYFSGRRGDNSADTTQGDAPVYGSAGRSSILYVLFGLVLSVPVLFVVIPLLASSDVVFENMINRMFSFKWNENIPGIIFMMAAVFFVSYAFVLRLSDRMAVLEAPLTDKRTRNPIIAITVSTVLLIIYGLYCAIQIVYLFMGYGVLPEGYTYAEYVHEGFYQLVFVCIINLVLVLVCRKYSRDNIILKVMLSLISACTFIMIFSSAYRMMLYIEAYGLTFLRIYVLWALVVIGLAMTGTCVYIYVSGMPFYKYSLTVLALTWMLFIFTGPDYRIAKYNLTHPEACDRYYIIHELSVDAAPAVEKYADKEFKEEYFREKIYLKREQSIRKFNYSKWRLNRMI